MTENAYFDRFVAPRWAFRMYDKDASGEIDLGEMVDIFCLMYAVQVTKNTHKISTQKNRV